MPESAHLFTAGREQTCKDRTSAYVHYSSLECVVDGKDYAGWLKVSASVGYSSAEVPEPYTGTWSKDLQALEKTKLIFGEGCVLKTNDNLKAILETLEWKGEK